LLDESATKEKLNAICGFEMNNMETGAAAVRIPAWLRIAVIGRNPKRTLARAAVLAVVCFVFFKLFVFKVIVLPVRIEGNSMFPTYHDRGINFVNRLAYRHAEPQRGDVVGIRMAGPSIMLMKRIVGLPGETVAFDQGRLLVNGESISEPYLKHHSPAPFLDPVKLGPNEYYVIGDNRMNSDRGRIDRGRIMGKIVL
jgi:signal peptidase I